MTEPGTRFRQGLLTDLADGNIRGTDGHALLHYAEGAADVSLAIREMQRAGWVKAEPVEGVYELTDLGARIHEDGLP